jgi:hypothetical protein
MCCAVSKDNLGTKNYSAERMFSVMKLFVIDSLLPAAIVISDEIYLSFGRVCGERTVTTRKKDTILCREFIS